jgi:hypothetical protein
MEAFMPDGRNTEEVIKSRQDLSANGIDRISSRIIKEAGSGTWEITSRNNPS